MKIMSNVDRYCTECGNQEYDKDGDYSHDFEPYDHDFEPEDEVITTQDVMSGLGIIGKGLDVWNKYKKATQPSQSLPTQLQKPNFSVKSELAQKDHELHNKLARIQDNISLGKKIERKRWIIGIVVSSVVAITIALFL